MHVAAVEFTRSCQGRPRQAEELVRRYRVCGPALPIRGWFGWCAASPNSSQGSVLLLLLLRIRRVTFVRGSKW